MLMAGEDGVDAGHFDRCSAAFSSPPLRSPPSMPEWQSATRRSHWRRRSGTCFAARRRRCRSRRPCRRDCALSHCMICGGTKPMTPIRRTCRLPGLVLDALLEQPPGHRPAARRRPSTLAQTSGNSALASEVEEVEPVVELVIAQRAAEHSRGRSWPRASGGSRRPSAPSCRRCSRPAGCPAGSRHCRTAGCSSPRACAALIRLAVLARPTVSSACRGNSRRARTLTCRSVVSSTRSFSRAGAWAAAGRAALGGHDGSGLQRLAPVEMMTPRPMTVCHVQLQLCAPEQDGSIAASP